MLLYVLPGIFVVLCIICAFMESRRTAVYKWFGVYGRLKAYIAMDFSMVGLMGLGSSLIPAVANVIGGVTSKVATIFLSLGLLLIGVSLYVSSYEKCPGVLRKGCIISMIITGLGITMKIALFFLIRIWRLVEPKEVKTVDGNSYFIINGDAYDPSGRCVGKLSSDRNAIVYNPGEYH